MRACQCQRLPSESKLERERGISRGYTDRLADRSIAVPRIAIAEDDGVASRYQRREEPSRISVLDNATGGGRIVQTVKLRR